MQISLSLAELIINALTTDPNMTPLEVAAVIGDVVNKRKTQGKYGSAYYQDNNTAIYMPVEVVVGNDVIPGTSSTYAEAFGVTDQSGNYTGRWWLPNPIMSIDLNVHVVDTELTERNGMVSELINIGGYKMNITGFLVNSTANEFPEDEYDTLNRLANLRVPFKINSVKTDIIFMDSGNTDKTVTIRNLRFPKRPGVKHVQEYELELWSEIPFNLIDIS